jgi:hypothetical protein
VSNSATNSVKRLNREAAAKAEAWIRDLGATQIIPRGGAERRLQIEESGQRPAPRIDPVLGALYRRTRFMDSADAF